MGGPLKMKMTALTLSLVAWSLAAFAQEHPSASAVKPAELVPGIVGYLYHPIWTSNPEAQKFFDQGLTQVYAFNHEEAIRSFQRAAELDPRAPMPWWGEAIALGPNYNVDVDPDHEKAAYTAIQKALTLAAQAPANERDYCQALAQRFSGDPKADYHQLALAYRSAMRQLAASHPDDPDAATLYAESIMDLNPWHLWTLDGKPAEGTEDILTALEAVLRAYPEHVGANHFYIHALEASPYPERALQSAARLGGMTPAAGHLVHMPGHIYIRTGDYAGAVKANLAAAAADRDYIKRTGTAGSMYDMMYYSHNLHFLAAACSMQGNFACARQAADRLVEHVAPGVKQMAMLEWFLPWQPFVLVRFSHWDDILAASAPDPSLRLTAAAWHYARCLAFIGKGQESSANSERQALAETIGKTTPDSPYGYNSAKSVLELAAAILDGKLAAAGGNLPGAVVFYAKAVAAQDRLNYDEPPDWFYPARETLGAALLANGNAAEAENVFRQDLARNPRNGRSLFGLWKALAAQNKTDDSAWVEREFNTAWQQADVALKLSDF